MKGPMGLKIYCYETKKTYRSMNQCAQALFIAQNTLSNASQKAVNGFFECCGYSFRYERPEHYSLKQPVQRSDGKVYSSVKEAAYDMNVTGQRMSQILKAGIEWKGFTYKKIGRSGPA